MSLVVRESTPFPHAVAIASFGAIGGFLIWRMYHAISGRNDGLAILILAMVTTTGPAERPVQPLSHELAICVIVLIPQVIMTAALGWYFAGRPEKYPKPAESPLGDIELDGPQP